MGRPLRRKGKGKSMKRKRPSLKKLRERKEKRNVKLRKGLKGRERRGMIRTAMTEVVIEALGEEVVVEGERKKDLEVAVLGNLALGVGEIGRRKRRMNGDQGVEMIAGGIMKDHRGGPHHLEEVLHLLEVKEEELGGGEMLRQEDLHQEEARLKDVDLHLR